MFLHGSSYSDATRTLVASTEQVDIAIAYLGSGAAQQMSRASQPRRILCDLLSGGTNPNEVPKLQVIPGVEIRHIDNLHAKVMVSSTLALVGSANFSENGVGWHDGVAGYLIEAGYHVTDQEQIKLIKEWFNGYWDRSQEITDDLIKQATINWLQRRTGRPKPPGDRFIIDSNNWRSYTGRGTRLIIWRDVPTAEQKASEKKLPDGLARRNSKTEGHHYLDYYHEFGKHLDLGAGVIFLDVHYQRNGKVICFGARRSLANGHQVLRGSRTIDAMEIIPVIDGQKFSKAEREALVHWLQPEIQRHYFSWCQELNAPDDTEGLVIDLDRVLKATFGDPEGRYIPEFQQLFELAKQISESLGWRCVTVASPGPEVRIGTGLRNIQRKETPALGRVNLRLSLRDGMVRCGSYLSKDQLSAYGTAVSLSGAEGRHWIQWPVELTASLLPRILDATRDRLETASIQRLR